MFLTESFVDKIAQKPMLINKITIIFVERRCTIDTKPQLEIFADDVKCSHGCTVGQLNDDAYFI